MRRLMHAPQEPTRRAYESKGTSNVVASFRHFGYNASGTRDRDMCKIMGATVIRMGDRSDLKARVIMRDVLQQQSGRECPNVVGPFVERYFLR